MMKSLFPHCRATALACLFLLLTACGGGGGGAAATGPATPPPPPPPPPPTPVSGGLEIPDLTVVTGSFAGQVTLRFTAPNPAATSYEIRAQVPHLNPSNALAAPVIPNAHVPGTAGAAEAITLGGLEPGQTLQFIVRAIRSGIAGEFSHGAGARVRDAAPPVAPGGAVTLFGPGTLSSDNTYYRLGGNISAAGTAFTITGRNITLDLGGFTITYGTGGGVSYGVYVLAPGGSGTTTITNGAITQSGANTASYSTAVEVASTHGLRVTGLTLTVQGPGAHGVWCYGPPSGTVRVDHCTINCNVTSVPNRHYPGVSAIYIEDSLNSVEIDHNRVNSSPQWGIKVAGTATNGYCWIHHNEVIGTRARVANGYMIGVYKPNALVFENFLSGESRGIHLDGVDNNGNGATIHDNYVFAQDQPNAEFNPHWCHGIKLENPSSATVVHNHVTVLADATHSEARAIDIDSESGGSILIYGNRISGLSSSASKLSHGVHWLGGTTASAGANNLQLTHNVFRSTDRLITRGWYAENGAPFRENAWLRDFSKVGNPFLFENWGNMPATASPSHRMIDPWTAEDTNAVGQFGSPGPYTATREWTLSIAAQNSAGIPQPGAAVSIRDRTGAVVFSGSTDTAGIARALLLVAQVTNGPTIDLRGPFQVSVTGAGGAYNDTIAMTGHLGLIVNMTAGTASADGTAPSVPANVYAIPLSASRAVVRWQAANDATGICYYLVYVNGSLERITDQTEALLAGQLPGTFANVQVQAVDGAGNTSALSPLAFFTTPPEDRGP